LQRVFAIIGNKEQSHKPVIPVFQGIEQTLAHQRELRAFYPCFNGPRASQEGVMRLITSGRLNMRALISHTPSWKECEPIYNALFTRERDHFNGIVIDWTDKIG
jgi:threonine dehydrogenase-like Zn-dependent dehydrogenase